MLCPFVAQLLNTEGEAFIGKSLLVIVCVRPRTYTHIYTYAHTHIYIHTYIHTYMQDMLCPIVAQLLNTEGEAFIGESLLVDALDLARTLTESPEALPFSAMCLFPPVLKVSSRHIRRGTYTH